MSVRCSSNRRAPGCYLAGSSLAVRAVVGGLIVVSLIGCGTGEPTVYPVTGKVLLDGQPLGEATVVFHPIDANSAPGRRSLTARTDANGVFRLTTHEPGDGAAAGEYGVTVEFRELVQEGDEMLRGGANLLPDRYSRPATSGLQCRVETGPNELQPFQLVNR